MRTRYLLILAAFTLATDAAAAIRVASVSGLWANPATWGGVVPIPGSDTASIQDGVTVTCNTVCAVGISGATGSVAVSLNSTGKLIVSAGGDFQPRGDAVYTAAACSNTTDAVLMQAGSQWHFDSSAATGTPLYSFRADTTDGCRGFTSSGTSGARNIISAMPGSGAGKFVSVLGGTHSGPFAATYTDFSNIGDATRNGWEFTPHGNLYFSWNVTYSTFTNCGPIASIDIAAGGVPAAAVFRHRNNVHSGSLGGEIFRGWANIIGIDAAGGGIREIRNNVFDVPFALNAGFYPQDFTILTNYFGNSAVWGPTRWAAFVGNFVRSTTGLPLVMQLRGDDSRNYYNLDSPLVVNPHGVYIPSDGSSKEDSVVVDHSGNIVTSESAWWQTNVNSATADYYFVNSIILPNAARGSSWWINAAVNPTGYSGTGTPTSHMDHNTVYADNNTGGVGSVSWHPGMPTTPGGLIGSFRSNIFWALSIANKTYKLYSFCHTNYLSACDGNLDPVAPAFADYNAGWNMETDGGADRTGSNFTNGGKGYADNFSSTPGVHDLDGQDPAFVDKTRNMATWDTAYLKNTASQWISGSHTYNIGDMVSNADAGIYGGAVINYRYINSTFTGSDATSNAIDINTPQTVSCGGANPKPGDFTNLSHACWEWASLYRIRQAIAAGTIYDDPANGITAADANIAVLQWVRSGMAPTNLAYLGAAHDNADIGALPVAMFASTATPPATTLPAVFRGVGLRGAGIRGGN